MKKVVIELRSGKINCNSLIDARNRPIAKELVSKNEKFNEMYGFGCEEVKYESDLKNLIHFSNLSNVVYVLMGQRPVPSKKFSIRKQNSYIDDEILGKGLFKITNAPYVVKKNEIDGTEKRIFYTEFTQGKKIFYNANSMSAVTYDGTGKKVSGYATWSSLRKRKYYSKHPDRIEEFISRLKEIGIEFGYENAESDISLVNLLYEIKGDGRYVSELIDLAGTKNGLTLFSNYFIGKELDARGLNSADAPNLAGLVENIHRSYKISIDGELILFMKDDDASVIKNGTKFASFLDGGLAKVKSIENLYEDDMDEYIEEYIDSGFLEIKNLTR